MTSTVLNPKTSFFADYELHRKSPIADGGFAVVYPARLIKNRSHLVAVKRIEKSIKTSTINPLNEASILSRIHPHPNILTFEGFYDEPDAYYLVTEYLPYGDLYALIDKDRENPLPEKTCRRIIREVLEGVRSLHEQNIVHR